MNALRDFIKAHISDKQKEEIKIAINNLETSLVGTIINLSGTERRRYGSINSLIAISKMPILITALD
ncbi:MAG: hypothetical protein MI739_00135 [Bacteroidales bacterium]|nr:hypothetical protein [Bacteroidales bacterium]